jgi:hypothetical protein
MFRRQDRASVRPLPVGLRICKACEEVRGTTPAGDVSACYCSGMVCNRCDGRVRRPITNYYDARSATWVHVPFFHLLSHRCRLVEGDPREVAEQRWTTLEPDPDVIAYQNAVTRMTFRMMGIDREIDAVDVGPPADSVDPGPRRQ